MKRMLVLLSLLGVLSLYTGATFAQQTGPKRSRFSMGQATNLLGVLMRSPVYCVVSGVIVFPFIRQLFFAGTSSVPIIPCCSLATCYPVVQESYRATVHQIQTDYTNARINSKQAYERMQQLLQSIKS